MKNIIFIGLGGFIGAVGRYCISLLTAKLLTGGFPYSTLLTNVLGAFLIGAVSEYYAATSFNKTLYLFITIGILGGFTTFSTFSLETFKMLEGGKTTPAVLYMAASVALCVLGVLLGKYSVGWLTK